MIFSAMILFLNLEGKLFPPLYVKHYTLIRLLCKYFLI
ncbi:hypothetical protein [Salmonella phage PHA46]